MPPCLVFSILKSRRHSGLIILYIDYFFSRDRAKGYNLETPRGPRLCLTGKQSRLNTHIHTHRLQNKSVKGSRWATISCWIKNEYKRQGNEPGWLWWAGVSLRCLLSGWVGAGGLTRHDTVQWSGARGRGGNKALDFSFRNLLALKLVSSSK